ncbi:MAG: hypothetical protein OXK80_00650 [Bdellovibrionales bacterium]|nr:hypothetical protein [Bdellovibrionales bacterium]
MSIVKLKTELSSKLPMVFPGITLGKILQKMYKNKHITDQEKTRVLKTTTKVPVVWNTQAEYKLLTFNLNKIQVIDILTAFHPRYYLSHFSALYLHELINHRPEEYFLSTEIVGKTPTHSKENISERIHQAFLKSPRKTSKYFMYQKTKITLLKKQDLKRIGVNNKLMKIDETKQIKIFFTSLERTLLDSIISPHYSGGIKTVINSFSKARINIDKLYKIYKAYSPCYPYWQSIGFLLSKLKEPSFSKRWLKYFSSPKIKFYLDKNFNEDWLYDLKWKIHYPKGVINDNR